MIWSLRPGSQLFFHTWENDEQAVVYEAFSGDTHRVDAAGLEILRLLETEPHSTEVLNNALCELVQDRDAAQVAEYVALLLRGLVGVGLVISSSP